MLLNALKKLAGIDKETDLISPSVIEPVQKLKTGSLGNHNPRLHTDEVLIALSVCGLTNEYAHQAIEALNGLKNCEVHSSVILSRVDENVFQKLGMHLTCDPQFSTKKLYHK